MAGARRIVALGNGGRRLRGRTYLYVFPCAGEDYAKLGIATDPMTRLQAFSSRYYSLFDLPLGWLVEAETEQEARSWETRWKRQLRAHAAPAPLTVPARAGGHTEWLRGALGELSQLRDALQLEGFTVHPSLQVWVRERLARQAELLASAEQAASSGFGAPATWPAATAHPGLLRLRDGLDAYAALQLPIDGLVSAELHAWHARNSLLVTAAGQW